MERTELMPQTSENLGTGTMFYHFSISPGDAPLDPTLEHQILFFESYFTEMKFGIAPQPSALQWFVSGSAQGYNVPFSNGTWYNFAYEIDFSGQTVGLWASKSSDELTKVVENVPTSASTDSKDFHVGMLRIVNNNTPESIRLSGVYIEDGDITTTVAF